MGLIQIGIVAAIAIAALATVALVQENAPAPGTTSGDDGFIRVTGSAKKGDVTAALRSAVRKASEMANRSGADIMVEWEMERIAGRYGGFAGFDEVTVTIRYPGKPR